MVTVLAEIPDRQRALREVARVLKPDGLLGVAEFFVDPDYPRRSTVIRWCEAAGFLPAANFGPWWNYMTLFRAAGGRPAGALMPSE
jgi:ubiquinone/menaquinone biosynthesis C-methylase UbiE